MTPAQSTNGNTDTGEDAELHELLGLLTSKGLIRRTHRLRLAKRTTPPWFTLPRGRRSFAAVVRLQALCTSQNVRTLLSRRWITVDRLESFIRRTRLGEGPRAILEREIRVENNRVEAHSNTGITGELRAIAAGGNRSDRLRTVPASTDGVRRYRRGEQVDLPA